MNCKQTRESVYEYSEGSLSPSEASAVEKHLAGCLACDELFQSERQLAHSLSNRLQKSVQTIDLDASSRRRMLQALQRELQPLQRHSYSFSWARLAFPFAISGLTLTTIFILAYSLLNLRRIPSRLEFSAPQNETAEANIHLSYLVTGYTFQKNGNLVDALTIETLVADGRITSE